MRFKSFSKWLKLNTYYLSSYVDGIEISSLSFQEEKKENSPLSLDDLEFYIK